MSEQVEPRERPLSPHLQVYRLPYNALMSISGNGVRHVLWSMGIGVNEQAGIKTGNIVLVMSLLLTIILWKVLCACCGQEYDAAPMTAEVQATQEAAEAQE